MKKRPNVFDRLRDVVSTVPAGRVSTYGQVSARVLGTTPRLVGFALAGLGEDSDVPWHRIVNAAGRISLPAGSPARKEQVNRLRAEGVQFGPDQTIDLDAFGWL